MMLQGTRLTRFLALVAKNLDEILALTQQRVGRISEAYSAVSMMGGGLRFANPAYVCSGRTKCASSRFRKYHK